MTLAAYMVNAPYKMDLPGLEQKAQAAREREFELQKMPGEVALANAQNANATNLATDLSNFRTRSMADDPNAVDALKGQPDKFKAMVDAFDGMSPDEYEESVRHATAFGKAARRVSSFAKGSREQVKAWDEELGKLLTDGIIDKQTHDHWVAQGPNDELINEAVQLDDWVKSQHDARTRKGAALEQAKIEDIGTDNARADKRTAAQIALDESKAAAATKNADSLETYRTGKVKIEEGKAAVTANDKNADNTRADKKLENDVADDAADNVRADKDLQRKVDKDTKGGSGSGKSGISEAEYGRRMRSVEQRVAKMRDDGEDEQDIENERQRLLRVYKLVPESTSQVPKSGEDATAGPPPMKDRVPGKVYQSPKGPMEWTGTAWRPAVNG